MNRLIAYKHIYSVIISSVAVVCMNAFADRFNRFNDASPFFYADAISGKEYNFFNSQLVPIHLMDTKTLFMAAEAERDQGMHVHQKLLNNRWLAEDSRNTHSGMKAFRRFCRLNLKYYFTKNRDDRGVKIEHDFYDNTLSISNLNNYTLSLGENKATIKYRQRFNLF